MSAAPAATKPFTIALVDDYDVVLLGLAHMFDDYSDTLVVTEIDANAPLSESIDVVLYDAFAQPESSHSQIGELVKNPRARHVVVYTWNFHPELIDSARDQGVHGYLSKTLPAPDLVAALEAVNAGTVVVSESPERAGSIEDSTGPAERTGSLIGSPRSWRSSRKARATRRSPNSPTSARTRSSRTSGTSIARSGPTAAPRRFSGASTTVSRRITDGSSAGCRRPDDRMC